MNELIKFKDLIKLIKELGFIKLETKGPQLVYSMSNNDALLVFKKIKKNEYVSQQYISMIKKIIIEKGILTEIEIDKSLINIKTTEGIITTENAVVIPSKHKGQTIENLTSRETELIDILASNFDITYPEIAEKMFTSNKTVQVIVQRILKKLSIKNRAGLLSVIYKLNKEQSIEEEEEEEGYDYLE